MKAIAFVPKHNRPLRKDVTGAFLPEARKFLETTCGPDWEDSGSLLVTIDNHTSKADRFATVCRVLEGHALVGSRFKAVAFFGHGYRSGLSSFGMTRKNVTRVAQRIPPILDRDSVVLLYSCLSGKEYVDLLADEMCGKGVLTKVIGHTTSGHTTKNPYVVSREVRPRVRNCASASYLVRPRSRLWKLWVNAMKHDGTGVRYLFWRLGWVSGSDIPR